MRIISRITTEAIDIPQYPQLDPTHNPVSLEPRAILHRTIPLDGLAPLINGDGRM
jgi:hypothetical protein